MRRALMLNETHGRSAATVAHCAPVSTRRVVVHLSALVYASSFLLSSFRIFTDFTPGHQIAWTVEAATMSNSWKLLLFATGQATSLPGGPTIDASIAAGATANHLFVVGYAAAIFRKYRAAAFFAAVAAMCAIGCLLPEQLTDLDQGWFLGPGYFAWCAAPVLLTVAAVREWRRNPMPRKG